MLRGPDSTVSGDGARSHAEEMFLAHLPPGTPVYSYHDYRDIETLPIPDSTGDSFVVVTNTPAAIFEEFDESLPGLIDYSPSLELLIIKMPSFPHEEAASSLEAAIVDVARQMNARRRLHLCGATRIDGPDRKKQADRSYKPRTPEREWPTVAVEVGYSQPRAKLEKDITWWINASHGQVLQGITLDIKQGSGNIEIISWDPAFPVLPREVNVSLKGRPIARRSIDQLPAPHISQKITIKRGKDGADPVITGGDLTISFATLLLDEPGEGEKDFVIPEKVLLHEVADAIWAAIDGSEAIRQEKKRKRH